MGVGGDCVIVVYAKKKCQLPVRKFLTAVMLPVLLTALVMILFGTASEFLIPNDNIWTLILCGMLTTIGLIVSMLIFGLTKTEAKIVKGLISKLK